MAPDLSRRRFLAGCGIAGTTALAAGATAGGVSSTGSTGGASPPPATNWTGPHHGGAAHGAHAPGAAPDDDGYVVAGASADGDASQAWLFKVGPNGSLVWERTFSERTVTVANGIASTGDGYVLAGYTATSPGTNQSGFVLRVDLQGNEQWRNTYDYDLGTTDTFEGVDQDPDGQLVLAGRTSRLDSGWIVRLDGSGNELLSIDVRDGRANHFYDVKYHESQGGYVAIGRTDSPDGPIKGWAFKIDADGNRQWSESYGHGSGSQADGFNAYYSFVETDYGFIIAGANAGSANNEERRGWVFGMNHFGGRLWNSLVEGRTYTELLGIVHDPEELLHYAVGMTADDASGTNSDGFLSQVSIRGSIQWTSRYDGSGSDEFSGIVRTREAGLVCFGSTAASAGGSSAGWGVKVGGRGAATTTPSPTSTDTPTDTPSPTPTATPPPMTTQPPATPTPTDSSRPTLDPTATDGSSNGTPTQRTVQSGVTVTTPTETNTETSPLSSTKTRRPTERGSPDGPTPTPTSGDQDYSLPLVQLGIVIIAGLGAGLGIQWWQDSSDDGNGSATEQTTTGGPTGSTGTANRGTASGQASSNGPATSTENLAGKEDLQPFRESPTAGAVPETIPRPPNIDIAYEDIEKDTLIGAGGNADVYRATVHTPEGPTHIAVKEPRISETVHTETVQRMMTEAETWDKLDDHDHIVGVVDYGSEPLPWIAMEYMDGGHLGKRVGELGYEQGLWTAIAVTKGVTHAHHRGVTHLDLKPSNILFRRVDAAWDVPKVADWGLAKLLLDHSKSVEGYTPEYAAPEQFDDRFGTVDHRTDVYQLGAVFYELFTGRPPFTGQTGRVVSSVMNEPPRPPSEIANVPSDLEDLLLKALAKRKADRYETASYFRDALQNLYNIK